MVLSEQDLIAMQELAVTFLPDDCVIQRPALAGSLINLTSIGTVKSLAILPQTSTGTLEDWSGETSNGTVFLPVNAGVQEGDLLTIKGQRMTVEKVRRPVSYEVLLSVETDWIRP